MFTFRQHRHKKYHVIHAPDVIHTLYYCKEGIVKMTCQREVIYKYTAFIVRGDIELQGLNGHVNIDRMKLVINIR